jgi:hypothetical protein
MVHCIYGNITVKPLYNYYTLIKYFKNKRVSAQLHMSSMASQLAVYLEAIEIKSQASTFNPLSLFT